MAESNLQIIPSIDLWQGQVVRLRQGRYDQVTVYGEDPVAIARAWRRKLRRIGTTARIRLWHATWSWRVLWTELRRCCSP